MSVQYDHRRRRYVVRWFEGGKRRVRRFVDETQRLAARGFDDLRPKLFAATDASSADSTVISEDLVAASHTWEASGPRLPS
jgi:hypothetical protein